MDTTSIISIIGIVGTLVGAIVGSLISYKGSRLQITHQEQKDSEALNKNRNYIELMILTFIKNEIELNCNILRISTSKNIPIENIFEIQFTEYEKAKYKLLENPTQIVKEVNKLYLLFNDILFLRKNTNDKVRALKLAEIKEQKKIIDKYFNLESKIQEEIRL